MRVFRALILLTFCVAGLARTAGAQTRRDGEWTVNVYPVPVFIPVGIDIKVDVPPSDGSGGGVGEIVESRFDGAFFGGVNATNGIWRIEGAGLWFAVGGNRREQPLLDVDLTVIYGDARLERRFAPHWYVMGGVRRIALD